MSAAKIYVPRDSAALSVGAEEVALAFTRAAAARGEDLRIVRNGGSELTTVPLKFEDTWRLGGAANSSPIANEGRIYVSDNEGATFVIKAGREFQRLATNNLGERITASPAVAGGRLFYRTDSHVYCIGEGAGR